ncbi:hypothetical protein VNO77_27382 [Canavalia gladiata]|uniref:Uncharacterized protein n=1 Tax=Canavalia gladiata TaxID=3824 RepID=A0AAN9Q6E7_CANGL
MIKTHYLPSVFLRTRLIVFYTKCDSLRDARHVLEEILEQNLVSWTAMISAYSRQGYASQEFNLFVQMLRSGTEPNEFTFPTVLTSCTDRKNSMPIPTPLSSASAMLRRRLSPSLRTRGGSDSGRWTSPGHEERPKGYLFNRTPLPPGQSRKWEDWELPCYITSFLTIVILGVGLNAKPDLTIETWAHEKALERLKMENNLAADNESS